MRRAREPIGDGSGSLRPRRRARQGAECTGRRADRVRSVARKTAALD